MRMIRANFFLVLLTCAVGLTTACPRSPSPDAAQKAPEEKVPKAPDSAAKPESKPGSASLFDWIEPEANAVVFGRAGRQLDLTALATVFALPPRAADVLTANAAIETALPALMGDGVDPNSYLSREWVSLVPAMAKGVYTIRGLARPKSEFADLLANAAMTSMKSDGFQVFTATGAFPWRIVILDDKSVAFVPRGEIGSGLSPLTAARDLPASALHQQLVGEATEDTTLISLHVAGPMLHLDLSEDIVEAHFAARRWKGNGLDGNVVLAIQNGDPAALIAELGERSGSLESDAVQAIMSKVAFTAEGPAAITGRLQMTADEAPRASR